MLRYVNTYNLVSLGLLLVLCWLVFRIAGDTGLGRISQLDEQISQQQIKVDTLQQRNQLVAEELQRLRLDENRMEVLARYHFGMIKPGEVFIRTDDQPGRGGP